MSSTSLEKWFRERVVALDQVEAAHRSVGGSARGRRYATEQINHAYAVLLSSQFQGFCRDLQSESADFVAVNANPGLVRDILRTALTQGRRLDRGNPNPGNVGADFNRFGLVFWDSVRSADRRALVWQNRLEELNDWRNAIAHQDFASFAVRGTALHLGQVQSWRRACNGLARTFDAVMRAHLHSLIGRSPW
jgi:hypothetical protein